ncbi:hypothetical protein IFM89_035873 [Coptis chinensis]|uniref:NADP-dependent oxidoreductase domain-containing protein n=1 Tax=Coptis chinensis TaxID=261450 RepID=A0A835GZN3_9MAGN|nr:hypothetical protein IFM89_035873 [Coptis chinensis]
MSKAVLEKRKVSRDEENPLGYYDTKHTKNVRDWKEVFDFTVSNPTILPALHNPEDHEVQELRNQWPEYPPEIRQDFGHLISNGQVLAHIVLRYLHFGVRNEAEVGEALAEAIQTGIVKREDLFITTKLWNSDHGHVLEACEDSLKKLHLEYLDLYLVHFPIASKFTGIGKTSSVKDENGDLDIDTTISLETTWHAMEGLVSMGLVRSIGVSNYDIFLIRDCLAYSKLKPAVNQIETHPYFQRDSVLKFCQKHGICVTAHTPLGGGTANTEMFGSVSCLDDPVLKRLAEKHNKTVAQIILRWDIQRNIVVIPKSQVYQYIKYPDYNHANFQCQTIRQESTYELYGLRKVPAAFSTAMDVT